MTAKSGTLKLDIALDDSHVSVSTLSSLLRTVQAAVRESARTHPEASTILTMHPQPVLAVEVATHSERLEMGFTFVDARDAKPVIRISELAFTAFFHQFHELLKRLPQRGLWGQSVGGTRTEGTETTSDKRMDQVRMELRIFARAKIEFGRQTILIEGAHMEIT